ncbi:MAG: hypothetical protein ABI906_00380 [Pseudomonadota bacterium]
MADIAGSPFEWLSFDAEGGLTDAGAQGRLAALLSQEITDLVVMSHGWKTDQAGAWALYEPLWAHVRDAWPEGAGRAWRGYAVAGVQWPSKTFRTDFDDPAPPSGGIAGLGATAGGDGDLSPAAFETLLGDFVGLVGPGGEAVRTAARAASGGIGSDQAGALLRAIQAAIPTGSSSPDAELEANRGPLDPADPQGLFLDLMGPPAMTLAPSVGAAMGLGDAIGAVLAGPRGAIARALNQFTYYEMKARAGKVGEALGARVLGSLQPARPVRLHLIGHSFGARLVTSAAASVGAAANLPLQSLTLLQAAFSHNALCASFGGGQVGAYPKVVGKVAGPISTTHTHNDSACTIAYALASRLVRSNSEAIGDASDEFGAIGANGAINLAAAQVQAVPPMTAAGAFAFTPGKVHNFNADACVKDHMDVTNPAVARLVAAALSA